MKRRRQEADAEERPEHVIDVPHDVVNEQVVLAAACVDPGARAWLAKKLPRPDFFLRQEHRPIWTALLEMERRHLDFDFATLQQMAGADAIEAAVVGQLVELRPEAPGEANLTHHVEAIYWDRQRAIAVQGPVSALVEALRRTNEPPERVRALAKHVADAFGGTTSTYLRDGAQLVAEVMGEVRRRVGGHACYPYGLQGLDQYEDGARNEKGDDIGGRYRMLPGAAPGEMTVVTAVSGGGKSTFTMQLAIGLARQRRKVLYGAWEMGGGPTLEIIACMVLGWSRTDLTEGILSKENEVELEETMHKVGQYIIFMDNPFQRVRSTSKPSNERNLDLVQQHVEDSACDVFIADLWDKCLVSSEPSEEKRALDRQHAMAEETRTHHMLLVQQRIKDVEMRTDKRPTREGIMGSSAWVHTADTILAPHRPALFKRVDDNRLELIVWKQRYGRWPQVVEFDWDAEYGSITGGRSIPFEHVGEQDDMGDFRPPQNSGGKKKRR